ncbi:type II secretion system protein [Fimbriimonas ginsengisoli]|uniref:Prepilin-type N-terminal cleavage/methylation domain-containing protein n=1 Tax=Fimbriimonas ginsengisoli Gsoil 348 TaxID=661478 RepID=A0A068NQQ4_FIMGI|nr:type II secretion system protein [Fimbriimonas ginsengisoli]AIE85771.1 hypothetical protein OP10G_2403 [Fimbriimonas ginsengisoli Gsoil 348]
MNRMRRAFTLIELLTVMTISAILLGLIVLPLFQSFNLTRAAQAFAEAQDRAKILTDRIARETGNAYAVRNSSSLIDSVVNGVATKVPQNALIISLPNQARNAWRDVVLPYTKLDLVRPAEGDQTLNGAGSWVDPVTGKTDPTLQAPKGQVVLPVAPGFGMIRYFIGRRDPFLNYNNPYDALLMGINGNRDNLYVMYRAEVQPWVRRANKNTPTQAGTIRWRPNLKYFASNDSSDPELDDTQIVDMDDPRFFEPNRNAGGVYIDDQGPDPTYSPSHAQRIHNWLTRAVVQTEVSRYDMILPVYDRRTRLVEYDSNSIPRVMPLVQFRPERVSNDPAAGQVAVRQGSESDTAESAGPDVFRTQYGQWSNPIVRLFPHGWAPATPYEISLTAVNAGAPGQPPGAMVYMYNPAVSAIDFDPANLVGAFDLYTYNALSGYQTSATQRFYPFTQAVASANSLSGWLSAGAIQGLTALDRRAMFTPYAFDANRGRIVTSFSISEVGDTSVTNPPDPDNLPVWPADAETPSHPAPPYTPINDPDLTGNFYDPKFDTINEKFNKVANDFQSLLPNNVDRFLDLRVTPNSDGTPSPLFPNPITGQATGFVYPTPDGGNRSRVQIVPGSDTVYGPDQLPGPNYGSEVRYTRISTGDPGPNQYKINYADLQEPTNSSGSIDYSVQFDGISMAGFNPRTYDPQNIVSAVLQPRFKVGYIKFNSDPNVPLPEGNIRVSYRFYFTGQRAGQAAIPGQTKTSSFAVDYDTRQLMNVLLTIRNYPQSSIPNPQTVTLKSTATVRNYTR